MDDTPMMKTPTHVCLFVCLFVCLCWRVPERPRRFFTFSWTCQHGWCYARCGVGGVMITFLGLANMGCSPSYLLCVFGWRPVLNLGSANGRTGNVSLLFTCSDGSTVISSNHPWDLLCWQTTYQPRGKYTKTNFLGRGSKWLCTCTKDRERKGFPKKISFKTFWTREIFLMESLMQSSALFFLPWRWCWKDITGSFQRKQVHLISGPCRTSFRTCDLCTGPLSFSDTEIDEVVAISDTERDDFVAISDTERDEVVASEVSRKCAGCSFSRCHRACIVRVLFTTSYFRLSATSKAEVRPSVATQHSWLPSSPCSLTGFILKTCSHGSWCLFTPHKVGALSCLCV